MLRSAHQLNNFNGLHITKLDVLAGLKKIKICTEYEINGKTTKYVPLTIEELEIAKPIYLEMQGFGDVSSAQRYGELPKEAQEYIEKIKELTKIPILSVSIGADRKDIIWL